MSSTSHSPRRLEQESVLDSRIQIDEHGEVPIENYPDDIAEQLQQAAFNEESDNVFVKRKQPVNSDNKPEIVKVEIEKDQITVSVQDIIGIVDLTPSSKIQINPKIGWDEILDIFLEVQEYNQSLDYHGIPIRDFLSEDISIKDIFVIVAVKYLNTIDPIFRHGFIREFETNRVTDFDAPGRIDIEKSLEYQVSNQGLPKHHFIQKVVNYDIPANKIIYQAGLELRQLFQVYSDEYDHDGYYKVFSQLENILTEFRSRSITSLESNPSQLARISIYDLPRQRWYYQKALEISKTILSSFIGEPLDEGRENLTMDYIISMENLFENYSEIVISKQIEYLKNHPFYDGFENVSVGKESHVLFENTSSYTQQPDHVIRKNKDPVAILDTKYYSEAKDPLKDTYSRARLLGYGFQLQVDELGFLCPLGKKSENPFKRRAGNLQVISPAEFSIDNYERAIEEYIRELFEVGPQEIPSQFLDAGWACHSQADVNSLVDIIESQFLRLETLRNNTSEIVQYLTGRNRTYLQKGVSEKVEWRNDIGKIFSESRKLKTHLKGIPDKYDRVLPVFFKEGDAYPIIHKKGGTDNNRVKQEQIRFYCFRFDNDNRIKVFEEEDPYLFDW